MLTTIAALYVILPAVLALASVGFAMCVPVAIVCNEEGIVMQGSNTDAGRIVYSQARDMYARRAVTAMVQYRHWAAKSHANMCAFWQAEAEMNYSRAHAMNAIVSKMQ